MRNADFAVTTSKSCEIAHEGHEKAAKLTEIRVRHVEQRNEAAIYAVGVMLGHVGVNDDTVGRRVPETAGHVGLHLSEHLPAPQHPAPRGAPGRTCGPEIVRIPPSSTARSRSFASSPRACASRSPTPCGWRRSDDVWQRRDPVHHP